MTESTNITLTGAEREALRERLTRFRGPIFCGAYNCPKAALYVTQDGNEVLCEQHTAHFENLVRLADLERGEGGKTIRELQEEMDGKRIHELREAGLVTCWDCVEPGTEMLQVRDNERAQAKCRKCGRSESPDWKPIKVLVHGGTTGAFNELEKLRERYPFY